MVIYLKIFVIFFDYFQKFEFFRLGHEGIDLGYHCLKILGLLDINLFIINFLSMSIEYSTWFLWFVILLMGVYIYRLFYIKKQLKSELFNLNKVNKKLINDIENNHIFVVGQLQNDIKEKRLEIVKHAKENEDKNNLISKIKEKIEDAEQQPSKAKIKWHEINLLVSDYTQTDDKTFELQMDEIHQKFIKNLKNKYPQLTSQDLRLCIYLKTGMNSKEIAEIMHVLPSSIYITRSRLRKKLNISPNDDLLGFLNSFES